MLKPIRDCPTHSLLLPQATNNILQMHVRETCIWISHTSPKPPQLSESVILNRKRWIIFQRWPFVWRFDSQFFPQCGVRRAILKKKLVNFLWKWLASCFNISCLYSCWEFVRVGARASYCSVYSSFPMARKLCVRCPTALRMCSALKYCVSFTG